MLFRSIQGEPANALQFHRVDNGLIAVQDLFIEKEKAVIRLAYSIPSSLIYNDYRPAIYYFFLVLLVSLAIVGVVALFVSRKFSSPIIELANAAAKLAEGALSTRVAVKASGELQVLVDSFNAMSSKLQAAYENRNKALYVLRRTIAQMRTEWQAGLVTEGVLKATPPHQSTKFGEHENTDDLNEITRVIDRLLVERSQIDRKSTRLNSSH